MAKKKRGGAGGGQQQQDQSKQGSAPAEEGRDDQAAAEDVDTTIGDGQAKEGEEDKGGGGKDQKGKEKEKKAPPLPHFVTAVLKVNMHCDGCARRIRASVRRFPGVEGVAMEVEKGTMTVVGRFDSKKLRDRVAKKTKKVVDLVGDKNKGGGGKGGGGGQNKGDEGEEAGKPDKEKGEEEHEKEEKDQQDGKGGGGNAGKGKGGGKDSKKPAVPVVATVVLKVGGVGLHCDGCMHRIRTKLFNIKGVEQVRMDMAKNQVSVTGTMDVKALPGKLLKKLRRPVDVVPPANNKKQNQDGAKDQDKDKAGKDAKDKKEVAPSAEVELWKCALYDQQALQATEFLLSDENPNACSVM